MDDLLSNPYYPLPLSYPKLTAGRQRDARVAVCSDRSSMQACLNAWVFFRTYYLRNREAFYRGGFHESPQMHYDIVQAAYSDVETNAVGCPRGGGKTTVILEVIMLEALTHPNLEQVYCTSAEEVLKTKMGMAMKEFEENELIVRDFGQMQPPLRGARTWSHKMLECRNDATIKGTTVKSIQRGARSARYWLDDPEYDPEKDTAERRSELKEQMMWVLTHVIMGTMRMGSRVMWTGTLHDYGSLIYHVCTTDDEQFSSWGKQVHVAGIVDEKTNKVVQSNWPGHWTAEWLRLQQERMGDAFGPEMMNQPCSASDRVFTLNSTLHEYKLSWSPDPKERNKPAVPPPDTRIDYHYAKITEKGHRFWYPIQGNACEFFDAMYRVALMDYAYSTRSWADSKTILVVGVDRWNNLWNLDAWAGKMRDEDWMELAVLYGAAWRVKAFGIETVARQHTLSDTLENCLLSLQQANIVTSQWRPAIVPIDYPLGARDKGPRIASGLSTRFRFGTVKFPAHLWGRWPWDQMKIQVTDFTPDLKLLKHDDLIDTLAMINYVLHGRGSTPGYLTQKAKEHELKFAAMHEGGIRALSADRITDEIVQMREDRLWEQEQREKNSGSNLWNRPGIVGDPLV